MTSRYDQVLIGINKTDQYQEVLEEKNLKQIKHYFTPRLRHPTSNEVSQLELVSYEWKIGDRYYKLAEKYYGDPKLWYIIAWFNLAPTESHLDIGQTIEIPLPLDKIMSLLRL